MVSTGPQDVSDWQLLLADWLGRAWRFDEAGEVLAAAAPRSAPNTPTPSPPAPTSPAPTGRPAAPPTRSRSKSASSADSERLLGPEHPDTLPARANLASSYRQAGRTTDAITIEERVVADSERLLGPRTPRHPHRPRQPRQLLPAGRTHHRRHHDQERVLADSERLLGAEHPRTLLARANLASSYWQAGRTNDAITIEERVLADSERLLGHEHPNTLTARANLASSYWQAGRTTDAITIEERVAQPTANGCSGTNTPTPSRPRQPRQLLPAGRTHHRRDHDRRARRQPTASGCSATNTPTPSPPAPTSLAPTGRPDAWSTPKRL